MTPLHPQARAVLDEIAAGRLSVSRPCDIAELRRLEQIEARFSGPPQVVASVSDMDIDGPSGPLRIRLYSPDAGPSFPAVMFMHGGGWALGSVELSDHLCRALCRASNMLVASVDYRLAPEHPFPAGLEDSFAALLWLHGQPDVSAIAVCGDSAGGNIRLPMQPQQGCERSEEHTSELQSHHDLVCRLLLEKKKKNYINKQRLSEW